MAWTRVCAWAFIIDFTLNFPNQTACACFSSTIFLLWGIATILSYLLLSKTPPCKFPISLEVNCHLPSVVLVTSWFLRALQEWWLHGPFVRWMTWKIGTVYVCQHPGTFGCTKQKLKVLQTIWQAQQLQRTKLREIKKHSVFTRKLQVCVWPATNRSFRGGGNDVNLLLYLANTYVFENFGGCPPLVEGLACIIHETDR